MTIRDLQLNFSRSSRMPAWAGWALLGLALAFIADLSWSYFNARAEVAQREERLAALSHATAARSNLPVRSVSKDELAFARETIRRIATPWHELFGALEAAASDKIALLSIEPDAKSGKVLIGGESQDYAAALDYMQRLRANRALANVHLVRHEEQENQSHHVVFSISASWTKAL